MRTARDGFIVGALIRTGFTGVAKQELQHDPFAGPLGRIFADMLAHQPAQ